MRRLAITLSAVAAVVFAVTLSAQGKDFTGKWAPDADKNPAAAAGAGGGGRGGGRGGGGPMTITMDAKTMKVERMAGQNTVTSTYNLDGSESKNTMPAGRNGGAATETVSTAKWDGAKLVITTKNANGDQVQSYYMEGSDLVTERTTANGPQKTYYKKS